MHLLQSLVNLRVTENLVAGEFDRADLVLSAFKNVETDVHRVGRRILELGILDLKIEITVAAVKFRQRVLVILKLVLLEHPVAGQPGKHPMPPGLELLAQFPLGKRRRADKFNFDNFDLRGLGNLKRRRAAPGVFIHVHHVFDLRAGIAVFLVKLLNLLAVGEQFLFVQRLADLGGDFFSDFGSAQFFVARDDDVRSCAAGPGRCTSPPHRHRRPDPGPRECCKTGPWCRDCECPTSVVPAV